MEKYNTFRHKYFQYKLRLVILFLVPVVFLNYLPGQDPFKGKTSEDLFLQGYAYVHMAADLIDHPEQSTAEEIDEYLNAVHAISMEIERRGEAWDDMYRIDGLAFFYQKNYTTAILVLGKSLRLNPKNYYSLELRGECKKYLYDFYGAVEDFTKAIRYAISENPSFPVDRVYASRGYSWIQIADFESNSLPITEKALYDFEKAIALDGENGFYYFQRGLALGMLDRTKEACLSLSRSGELGYLEAYDVISRMCTDIIHDPKKRRLEAYAQLRSQGLISYGNSQMEESLSDLENRESFHQFLVKHDATDFLDFKQWEAIFFSDIKD